MQIGHWLWTTSAQCGLNPTKPNYNGLQKAEAEVLLLQETSLARNFKGGY
jgi:hypothetical protein